MKRWRAARWVIAYLITLAAGSLSLNRWIAVNRDVDAPRAVIVSEWQYGARVARHVVSPQKANEILARSAPSNRHVVAEEIIDEGPVLGRSRLLFGAAFVPNHDGIKVSYQGRVAYLTPDDLLRLHAYDEETELLGVPITLGVRRDVVLTAAAAELGISSARLLVDAKFRRLAIRPHGASARLPMPDVSTLRGAVLAAADYLARQVTANGTFRYELDPFSGETLPDYNWPRHAGATWFLARVANEEQDEHLRRKARLALNQLTSVASQQCGRYRCIGQGMRIEVGSSALTLLALCSMYSASLNPDWERTIRELAEFIRSQQRPDGEFAHTYDRATSRVIDEQFPYFSGEAALALSRAHLITHDDRDLESAKRAVEYLVARPSLFVTWRYFWRAEHWTCQAVTDLWTRVPNEVGLDFCLAWQQYNRGATSRDPEYKGAAGRYLFRSVPLTGAASSTEGAVATLAISKLAAVAPERAHELEQGIRNSLALLLRHQFTPGPEHLMTNPGAMRGGVPASTTDLRVRIDYVQHAGAAWLGYLRWLKNESWDL